MSILIYKQRHRHPNYKKTPKGNYAHIGYIATRPGAVKNEGMRHGLFGKLEPGAVKEFDTWQEAARLVRELSYRRVNMYRGIISFHLKRPPNWGCPITKRGRTISTATF